MISLLRVLESFIEGGNYDNENVVFNNKNIVIKSQEKFLAFRVKKFSHCLEKF